MTTQELLRKAAALLEEIGYPTNPGMGDWLERRDEFLRLYAQYEEGAE